MFKINNIFLITGRGQVIAGIILNGQIDSGDFIQTLVGENLVTLKIKSVEAINNAHDFLETGLLMEPFDEDSINLNDIIGRTATIIKA